MERTRWFLLLMLMGACALGTTQASADTFTVVNTDNTGPGSLRQAIEDANAHPNDPGEVDEIHFNIPGEDVHTIAVTTELPEIIEGVAIRGYTQPGSLINTSFSASNAKPTIQLSGSGISGTAFGLKLFGDGSSVSGLVINLFSGDGIVIDSENNVVWGCFIGTDPNGATPSPNSNGIRILRRANRIGGGLSEERNVISGNSSAGILINETVSQLIQGNLIGTDKTGMLDLGNAHGILLGRTQDVQIGGTLSGERNVISANRLEGIRSVFGVRLGILGNRIGVAADGISDLGNGSNGVDLLQHRDSEVGDLSAFGGNIIAFNALAGVRVDGAGSFGNIIRGNSIHNNGHLGIDLAFEGVTPNDGAPDADQGANRRQNFPILTSVQDAGNDFQVVGELDSIPNTSFRIDFYGNLVRDPSGHGEGSVHLFTAVVMTDAGGHADINVMVPNTFFCLITATATDPENNTSEFSPAIGCGGQQFTVTNTNDTGPGSLRQAFLDSNANGSTNEENKISFNIPGAGPHKITLASALPSLANHPVRIDGFTQPGSSPNDLEDDSVPYPIGDNASIQVQLDGSALAVGHGVHVNVNNSTVRGLSLSDFPQSGIHIDLFRKGVRVEGCYVGLTPDGTAAGNLRGITVGGEDQGIGGASPAEQNVIGANLVEGILATATRRLEFRLNLIGIGRDGSTPVGSQSSGMVIEDSDYGFVAGNTIAEHGAFGVRMDNIVSLTLRKNSIFGNPFGGIDGGANFVPFVDAARLGNSVLIAGRLDGEPDMEYRIEFFANSNCVLIAQGKEFLGATDVLTDSVGDASFSVIFPDALVDGQAITATATDEQGNTSGFSECKVVATANAPSYVGPSPYVRFEDSPLDGFLCAPFHLEDFEDGLLNTPGVMASAGAVTSPGATTDSVDADDGAIDGSGTAGRSLLNTNSSAVTFTFDSGALGGFPTHVGIVWTDGESFSSTTIEAFDSLGASLGATAGQSLADGSNNGDTGEDRFFGVIHPGGISAITLNNTTGYIEVDHLQYTSCAGTNVLLDLTPTIATNEVGTDHAIIATVLLNGSLAAGVPVEFEVVSGPNDGETDSGNTNGNGEEPFVYTGDGGTGTDTIRAIATVSGQAVTVTVSKVWIEAAFTGDCSLAPSSATNTVGEVHSVTVTVTTNGSPVNSADVSFFVSAGPHAGEAGMGLTDSNGEAVFMYTGTAAGTDTIMATGLVSGVSFSCSATKVCVESSSTVVCSIDPPTATNAVNTAHDFIVTVTTNGNPISGVTVTASITEGPQVGKFATNVTDNNGDASFEYTSEGALGTDTIMATGIVEGVSFSCSALKVWVVGPCPDLSGTWGKVKSKCKVKNEVETCKLSGKLEIPNGGAAEAAETIVRFYLSDDATFDGGDTLIGESTVKAIKVGKTGKGKLKTELVNNNPSGRFLIAVVDAGGTVSECDENNNVAVFGPLE